MTAPPETPQLCASYDGTKLPHSETEEKPDNGASVPSFFLPAREAAPLHSIPGAERLSSRRSPAKLDPVPFFSIGGA